MDDRITSITIDGRPMDPSAAYRIRAMTFRSVCTATAS